MRINYITFILLLCLNVSEGMAQRMKTIVETEEIKCYAANYNSHTFVPPPVINSRNSSARIATSTFNVNYNGFTPEAQAAFQYAVDIWASLLKSDVPITVNATFEVLDEGILGSAIWGSRHTNFGGGKINTWYPAALAEKLAGRTLNNVADIRANFSSEVDWYYGTDGKAPSGTFDMVTVVLHELGHGLGMIHSFNVSGSTGFWGVDTDDNPMIYDKYVSGPERTILVEQYPNSDARTYAALTSNNVVFKTTLAADSNGGVYPKLYAPGEWSGGSSVSHLDESKFGPGLKNSLMTPQLGFAEAIHSPGPIVLAMFADLGWINTKIEHVQLKNTENFDEPFTITAKITSDTEIDPSLIKLVYSFDGFVSDEHTVTMTETSPTIFQADIEAPGRYTVVDYFITLQDKYERTINSPEAPYVYRFEIAMDTEAPVVKHTPLKYAFLNQDSIYFEANVEDFIGISEGILHYKINDSEYTSLLTEEIFAYNPSYAVPLKLIDETLQEGDIITYYFDFIDRSSSVNSTRFPETGEIQIEMIAPGEVLNTYFSDFSGDNSEWAGYMMDITTAVNFNSPAIHSAHPYNDGYDAFFESNAWMVLKNPILINSEYPWIEFDEIVLVEPGEIGSFFGSSTFWDYVIVEGSKDEGKTWKPFTKGYDSNSSPEWFTLYNTSPVGDNSGAKPKSKAFRKKSINLIQNKNFAVGDEVLIRFRLFSDQLAHGWGWVVDNVFIQEVYTGVESSIQTELAVYPNPSRNGYFTLEPKEGIISGTKISVTDLSGRLVFYQVINEFSTSTTIDLSSANKGTYILQIENNKVIGTQKIMKVN